MKNGQKRKTMKKILVIGAGFLQAFVIKRAKELGYYVLAVDGNPNAVGFALADEFAAINIVDQQACLAYAKTHRVDGVLTAATDYGVLTASYIAQELHLPGISYEAAQRIKNKYLVRQCLYHAGADDTGLSHLVSNVADIPLAQEQLTFPVMVKPSDGSGSRGAARVDDKEDFHQACVHAMDCSLTHTATIEPFITGVEYGVESFVDHGTVHVMAVMQKWMTKPPCYAELGHAIPSGLDLEVEEKIKTAVEKAIVALGVNFGSVNMDILLSQTQGVHIIDVGARMGGNLIGSHLIPHATGIDYIGNMIRGAAGDSTAFQVTKHQSVATRLLALQPGKVQALPDMHTIATTYDVDVQHHISVGDVIESYRTNLDGMGYVVAHGETLTKAIEQVEQAKKAIDLGIKREEVQ